MALGMSISLSLAAPADKLMSTNVLRVAECCIAMAIIKGNFRMCPESGAEGGVPLLSSSSNANATSEQQSLLLHSSQRDMQFTLRGSQHAGVDEQQCLLTVQYCFLPLEIVQSKA
jgi:hypothetical protein